jgi:hypothetical protein
MPDSRAAEQQVACCSTSGAAVHPDCSAAGQQQSQSHRLVNHAASGYLVSVVFCVRAIRLPGYGATKLRVIETGGCPGGRAVDEAGWGRDS